MDNKDNWYNKFNKKSSVAESKNKRKQFNKKRDKFFDEKRKSTNKLETTNNNAEKKIHQNKVDASIISSERMFNFSLTKDAKNVLDNFDSIIQDIRPLNSKQFLKLPKDIRELSHQLTDERDCRRVGYMNAAEELSAYVRYFTWWNLIRFTRIFSNLPKNTFSLKDGDACIDIGSGPLTVVTSLWLSCPELRNIKLIFYCIDLSQSSLSLGEDIYLSIAAKLPPSNKDAPAHWNIIRVKGNIGISIKQKAALISCANMFNEIRENNEQKPDELADKQIKTLLSYADEKTSIFIAEPGMPIAAHFISLMREKLLKKDFNIISPCPHEKNCPMNGLHARFGGSAKWCNFSFTTEDAPSKLLKLSKDAGIPKERAVISFIVASKGVENIEEKNEQNSFNIRIASDPIWLPGNKQGFYSCTEKGLVLTVNTSHKKITSGDKIKVSMINNMDTLAKDKKSNAILINI